MCQDLTIPANGAVVYSDIALTITIPRDEGSTANCSCVSGFLLTGNVTRMFTTIGWDGSDPGIEALFPIPGIVAIMLP